MSGLPIANGAEPFKGVLVLPVVIETVHGASTERRAFDNKCGTITGAKRHANRGEELCEACLIARQRYMREWMRARRKSGAA